MIMKMLYRIKRWFSWFWYQIILRNKYFVGYDFGSDKGDCAVVWRKDRKGIIHVEEEYFTPSPKSL